MRVNRITLLLVGLAVLVGGVVVGCGKAGGFGVGGKVIITGGAR